MYRISWAVFFSINYRDYKCLVIFVYPFQGLKFLIRGKLFFCIFVDSSATQVYNATDGKHTKNFKWQPVAEILNFQATKVLAKIINLTQGYNVWPIEVL